MASPLIIVLLGCSGSGKDTQARFLIEKFGLEFISSGNLLRARKQVDDFTGRKIASQIDKGKLAGTPTVFHMWMAKLEQFKNNSQLNGFVIEGSPRRLIEAQFLDEALEWYEWQQNFHVVLVNVSQAESERRLLARAKKEGRVDDSPAAIKARWQFFQEDVFPVIDYYRAKGALVEVDGQQSPEQVFGAILQVLRPWVLNF